MAASGRVVTIKDVVEQTGGMILPNQINKMNTSGTTGFSTSGWTTGLTVETLPINTYSYSYWPSGYFKVIPAYAVTSYRYLLEGLFSGGLSTYSYQNVAWSAQVGSQVYSVFPYKKNSRLRVYEDLTGSVNFEYFYLRYNGSNRASKTWSSISKSWTGMLETNLYKTDTQYSLSMYFGGMNSSRRIYYSDNIVSPGAWIYIGAYTYVNASPGIDFAAKTFISSGVTRCFSGYGVTYNDLMNCSEYLYRLHDISIGVGYSSAPSTTYASRGTTVPTWSYKNVCIYSCSCDCDYTTCSVYTS